jgi:hypothetical protein
VVLLGKEQQMIVQISLVITLVLTQQVRLVQIFGLNSGYEARNSTSPWSKCVVIVQQALVTQILGQNAGFQATNASYSTLIGYNVGQVQ